VNREQVYGINDLKRERRISILEPILKEIAVSGVKPIHTYKWFVDLSNRLYDDGMSCLDIIQYLEEDLEIGVAHRQKMIRVHFCFNKIKGEFRSEKMLMMYLFDFMFLRLDCSLKNISFL